MKTQIKSPNKTEKLKAGKPDTSIKHYIGTHTVTIDITGGKGLLRYFSNDSPTKSAIAARRIVKAVNMHDELIDAVKLTKAFFDAMPGGQFARISCDVGLMNDMFSKINACLLEEKKIA